mmetsp:Transcript_34502/g.91601  ORF Transcript_34502/g.91601 Transcript_34502/m.91601 type:complete len:328 (+) Transcript_34502:4085-5068(+)
MGIAVEVVQVHARGLLGRVRQHELEADLRAQHDPAVAHLDRQLEQARARRGGVVGAQDLGEVEHVGLVGLGRRVGVVHPHRHEELSVLVHAQHIVGRVKLGGIVDGLDENRDGLSVLLGPALPAEAEVVHGHVEPRGTIPVEVGLPHQLLQRHVRDGLGGLEAHERLAVGRAADEAEAEGHGGRQRGVAVVGREGDLDHRAERLGRVGVDHAHVRDGRGSVLKDEEARDLDDPLAHHVLGRILVERRDRDVAVVRLAGGLDVGRAGHVHDGRVVVAAHHLDRHDGLGGEDGEARAARPAVVGEEVDGVGAAAEGRGPVVGRRVGEAG